MLQTEIRVITNKSRRERKLGKKRNISLKRKYKQNIGNISENIRKYNLKNTSEM